MKGATAALGLLGIGACGCVQALGLERAQVDPTLEGPVQEVAVPAGESTEGPTCQHFDNDQRLGARGGQRALAPLPPVDAAAPGEGLVQ